jgi:hypothetical protein
VASEASGRTYAAPALAPSLRVFRLPPPCFSRSSVLTHVKVFIGASRHCTAARRHH